MERSGRPEGSIRLRTYAELEKYVAAFASGHINLLVLIGAPGLAKSRTVQAILRDDACWIVGQATAFGMYLELFKRRDEIVVIDDVDSLYSDRNGVRLLKCLCQTEIEKTIAWHSSAALLKKLGVPSEFTTTSRAIIICNDWRTLNQNVAAIEDRGHILVFSPTAEEVHARACTWLDDAEILNWFAENLGRIPSPSLRHYVRAVELKGAGMDWTNVVPLTPENVRKKLVLELKADHAYPTEESRARAFIDQGGGCRSTYFNYVKRLRD